MHTQPNIYRYAIARGLANAVYEAFDEITGERVIIHQWTPETAQREAARTLLAQLVPTIDAELCSAGTSLFLVSRTPQQATQALETLRRHTLFTGIWLNDPSSLASQPPPLPPPIGAMIRPPLPSSSPQQNRGSGTSLPPPLPPTPQQEHSVNDIVRDYNQARSMKGSSEELRFFRTHQAQKLACTINLKNWNPNGSESLKFGTSKFGIFIAIPWHDCILIFPDCIYDYATTRKAFEGVFDYPTRIGAELHLTRPAIAQRDGSLWILKTPGEISYL